jgi:hypothetical protein
VGIASAVSGIMIAPIVMLNRILSPGNRYFANAYPDIVASRLAPTALTLAYRIVLSVQRR